jgi:hypothetical protein
LTMITTFFNSIGQCSLTGCETPNGDCSSYRAHPGPICRFRRSESARKMWDSGELHARAASTGGRAKRALRRTCEEFLLRLAM